MKEKIINKVFCLLESHTINQISVKEICEELKISRQSFYYHYKDIYDVVESYLYGEVCKILDNYSEYENMSFAYLSILMWLKSKEKIILNVYKSLNHDTLIDDLYNLSYPKIENLVYKETNDIPNKKEYKNFITRCYTLSIIIITIDWIKAGMSEDPNIYVKRLIILFDNDFKKVLRKLINS